MNDDTWADGPLLGFDLETTGVDPETARIVQLAFSRWDGDHHLNTIAYPVNPGVPIPAEATAIHGFTDAMVAAAMPHDDALDRTVATLIDAGTRSIPLVGMNCAYDLTIVARRWADLVGDATALGTFLPPVLDVFVLDKHYDKYRKGSRRLEALADHYGIGTHDLHDAAADAELSVGVLLAMARRFPEMALTSAADLTALQRGWAMEQAESLDAYLRKAGKPGLSLPGDGTWPIRAAA